MRRYQWLTWGGIFLCLSILLSACGTGATPAPASTAAVSQPTLPPATTQAPASTAAPSPQGPQSGKLDLVSTSGYKDSSGDFHVVGLVHNGMSQAVDNVELTLVMKDASGKTLLRDQNNQPVPSVKFSPILDTLAPGEVSPFDYFVNTADVGEPAPNGYTVTITGQETTTVTRATLAIKNLQMISDGSGSLYITGEILNADTKPVQISSFGAAALDSSNAVLAATDSGDMARTLAPSGDAGGNDRTPFSFQLDFPGNNAKQPAIYLDATEASPAATPNVSVKITNSYFDQNKNYHLVGTMTNNTSTSLNVRLIAGLFAKDGSPLDADTVDSAFYLGNGESVSFDFNNFQAVNSIPDLAAKIDHNTVQVDPYWTLSNTSQVVSLTTSGDKATDQGSGEWTYTGTVTNNSGKTLSGVAIVVSVFDSQNNLVATTITSPNMTSSTMAPNETDTINATIDLDPGVDASHFTFKTSVQAVVQ